MVNNKKEVDFNTWCPQCKYEDEEESVDVCNECLTFGYNINSHKPVCFKEKDDAEENK